MMHINHFIVFSRFTNFVNARFTFPRVYCNLYAHQILLSKAYSALFGVIVTFKMHINGHVVSRKFVF